MSVLAQMGPHQQLGNRRYVARRPLKLGSVLADSGAEVIIRDLSQTGLLIETSRELVNGETLLIEIPDRGSMPATVVWNSGCYFGCEFKLSIPAAAVSAALLQSPILGADLTIGDERDQDPHALEDDGTDLYSEHHKHSWRSRAAVILGLSCVSWVLIGSVVVWLIETTLNGILRDGQTSLPRTADAPG